MTRSPYKRLMNGTEHLISDANLHGPQSHVGEEGVLSMELGNQLIQIYRCTDSVETRKLITGVMEQAGMQWLRRLIMRNSNAGLEPSAH